jgi:glycosyltransferase involved in cell wall biosynthesis
MSARFRVLHTEVGGSYGGSLRALEVYLKYADRTQLSHDLLLYFPTPGAERLSVRAGGCSTLCQRVPAWLLRTGQRASAQRTEPVGLSGEIKELVATLRRRLPLLPSLIRVMAKGDYQLVHVNNTFTYQPEAVIVARRLKIPVVAHVRNPTRRTRLAQFLMRSAHVVVAVSRAHTESLVSWAKACSVVTIRDGAELPAFDSTRSARLRESLLPSNGLLVGSVGRLDAQKGYPILLRAARYVLDHWEGPTPLKFVIAGEGAQRAELETLIRELNLRRAVTLCGFVPDPANFIAALDLFVCSSLWEGLPLALVEALLLRVPVVATAVGGIPELIAGVNPVAPVPPGDDRALGDAILAALQWQLSKTETERSHALEAVRALTAELHDPRTSARRLDELFARVIEGSCPRQPAPTRLRR